MGINQETKNFMEELNSKKEADKKEKHRIELLIGILGILTIIVFVLVVAFLNIIVDHGNEKAEDSIIIAQKEREVKQLLSALESKDNKINELETQIESFKALILDTEDVLKDEEEKNKKLVEDNKTLLDETSSFNEKLNEVKERLDKYEKYDYAMFSQWDNTKRNDLNYDYIAELEDLLAYKPVDDIDFYLSWILIESDGKANAKNPNSTAKGFGQFLDGTSKSVYNTYLLDKYQIDWYPNIVIDHPDIALDMMVEYVNYLYIECSRSVPTMIDCYRGLHDSAYIAQFEKNLAKSGKTIAIINNKAEEKYQSLLTAVG